MWREILDYGRRLISIQRTVDRHESELRGVDQRLVAITQELRILGDLVREYRHEQEKDRAAAEKDREILMLRLENLLLKSERGLPPGKQPYQSE